MEEVNMDLVAEVTFFRDATTKVLLYTKSIAVKMIFGMDAVNVEPVNSNLWDGIVVYSDGRRKRVPAAYHEIYIAMEEILRKVLYDVKNENRRIQKAWKRNT
jgi:hypothetical protein